MCCRSSVILILVLQSVPLNADVFRWDNGQVIPGTEGIEPGPGVALDHLQLQFSRLQELDLTNASFQFSDLTNARLFGSTLAESDLTGAVVVGASFSDTTSRGFTHTQLYSTASYQARDLQGIGLGRNDLTGWDLSGQNLTNANLAGSTLTDSDLAAAVVSGTFFGSTPSLTFAHLASTASYQARDLRGIGLGRNDLTGWDLSGQDLSNASLDRSTMTNVDLTGAIVTGADLTRITANGFAKGQLYSTASYQAKNLQGINLVGNDLTGWDLSGQNLTDAAISLPLSSRTLLADLDLTGAIVTGASIYSWSATNPGFTKDQVYSTASYQAKDLQGIFLFTDLTGWDFSGQNLTNAYLYGLTDANLNGAVVTGARLEGVTQAQLASTASYQARNLRGIGLSSNDLTGWDLSGQDLTNADLHNSTLTNVDFFGAEVMGVSFTSPGNNGLTKEQVYSTASYKANNLQGIELWGNDLTGWDLSGQNLTDARLSTVFSPTSLTDVDLTGAIVARASFANNGSDGFTKDQLYSTASYQAKNLHGINLEGNDLTGWDFSEQNLANANLGASSLTNANFAGANLKNAILPQAVGVQSANFSSDTVYNQWTVFPGNFDPVTSGLTFEESRLGDIDANDILDIDDLNLLTDVMEINHSSSVGVLRVSDLNGDEIVDASDARIWVTDVKQTYLGDANLNGEVDFADFLALSGHFAQPGGWSEGDFDFSGDIQFSDFLILSDNFGKRSTVTMSVPEPNSLVFGIGLVLAFISRRRRRALVCCNVPQVCGANFVTVAPLLWLVICVGHAQGQVGRATLGRIEHDGRQRTYRLYVPSSYTSEQQWPLVFNFHGQNISSSEWMPWSRMNEVAEREGFIVVYPDATNRDWFDGEDVSGFVDALVGHLSSEWSLEQSRLYATGGSQGAMVTYLLAATRPDLFAAFAPVGGTPFSSSSRGPFPVDFPVVPSRTAPLLHLHGTGDRLVEYGGGSLSTGPLTETFPPVEDVVGAWLRNNGSEMGFDFDPLPDVDPNDGSTVHLSSCFDCSTYIGQSGEERIAEVLLYRVDNGGHNLPGDASVWPGDPVFHPVNQDIDGSTVIWEFFSRHELPAAVVPEPSGGSMLAFAFAMLYLTRRAVRS